MGPNALISYGSMSPHAAGEKSPFVGLFGHRGGVQAPPELEQVFSRNGGTTLRVHFDKGVTHVTEPTITATDGAVTATYSAGTGSRVLRYTLSRPLALDEVQNLAFSEGAVTSAGLPLAAVSDVDIIPQRVVSHGEEYPVRLEAAVKRSNGTGVWSAGASWVGGVPPTAADNVVIDPTHVITVDDETAVAKTVLIYTGGKLAYSKTVNSKLVLNLITIADNGQFEMGTEGDPIGATVKARLVIRNSALPAQIVDPRQFWNGMICLDDAVVTIRGAAKTSDARDLRLAVDPMVGHTTLTMASAPTGWRIGDTIVIPPTCAVHATLGLGGDFEAETFTISNIVGAVITLDHPVEYDHPGAVDKTGATVRRCHVINLTRSASIESEDPNGVRGHTLFTNRVTWDVEDCEGYELGRTTGAQTFPGVNENPHGDSFDNTIFDEDTGILTYYGTNQAGRYPWHAHHQIGPVNVGDVGYQFRIVGCTVNGGKKWGIAIHGSNYGLVERNNIFNCHAAAIALETGAEWYNEFNYNVGFYCVGTAATDPTSNVYWGMNGALNTWVSNVGAGARLSLYDGHIFHLLDNNNRGAMGNNDVRRPLFRGADVVNGVLNTDYVVELNRTHGFTLVRGNEGYSCLTAWSTDHYGGVDPETNPEIVLGTLTGVNDDPNDPANFENAGLHDWACGRDGTFTYGGRGDVTINGYTSYGFGQQGFAPNSWEGTVTLRNFRMSSPNQIYVSAGSPYGVLFNTGGTGNRNRRTVVEHGDVYTGARPPVSIQFSPTAPNGPPDSSTPAAISTVRNVLLARADAGATLVEMPLSQAGQITAAPCSLHQAIFEDFQQVAGDDFQAFYTAQGRAEPAPNLATYPNATQLSPTPGLTNQQAWDTHAGYVFGGELPPVGTTTRAEVDGLVFDTSTFTPADLPTLRAWYTAAPAYCFQDVGASTPCGDGDPVYTWTDRSGLGHHLVQADIAKRPILRQTAGVWRVDFDGIDDFMAAASYTQSSTAGQYMGFRYRLDLAGSFPTVFSVKSGVREIRTSSASGTPQSLINSGAATADDPTSIVGTAWVATVANHDYAGDTVALYRDGLSVDTDADSTDPSGQVADQIVMGSRAGASLFWPGGVREAVYGEAALSAGEVTNLSNYLTA